MTEISVIIPTYNRAHILPVVIEALRRQDFPSERFEIVVVDDGSTDGTAGYLASLGGEVVHLRGPHAGAARARNLGAEHARGRIFAFTDDDCRPEPDWLTTIAASIGRRRHDAALLGHTFSRWPATTFVHSVFKDSEPVVTCNFAVPRRAFEHVGGFDTHFILYFEDEDLGLRLKKAGCPIVVEPAMRVEHPSRYQTFAGFLRQRTALRYLCYMSRKHPGADHWERHRGVVRQILRRTLSLGIPLVGAFVWPPLLVLVPVELAAYIVVDGRRALEHRRQLRRIGMRLRAADFAAFTLLNWAVPFVDAWWILEGCARDWRKASVWRAPDR